MADPIGSGATVAVLGTGIMGAAIAERLAAGGYVVRAWNRTRAHADPLSDVGVEVAGTPAEACEQAVAVITSLSDADAVQSVIEPLLARLAGRCAWIQMSTVGVAGADRLTALAAEHGADYLDAPVLGTRGPAQHGTLRVLASGPKPLIDRCRPLLEVMGTVLEDLGDAGAGSRLKLAVNQWVLALNDATAASLTLSERLGLPGQLFLSAIAGSPTDAKYAQLKGGAMLSGKTAPSFTLANALKDARLIAEATHVTGMGRGLIDAIVSHLRIAVDDGHGDEDMAAVINAYAQPRV